MSTTRLFKWCRFRRRATAWCSALLGIGIAGTAAHAQAPSRGAVPLSLPDSLFQPLVSPAVLPYGYPPNEVHKPEILALIQQRRFDEVENRIGSLRGAVARDARHELRLFTLYDALDREDSVLLARLDEWIVAKPRSANAMAGRALYRYHAAWRARGGAYIANTTVGRLRAMDAQAALAAQDLAAALALDSTHFIPYYIVLGLGQLAGEQEMSYRVLQRALPMFRGTYLLRSMMMGVLKPRWGGSYEAMRIFAEESARDSASNPRLVALRAKVLIEQAFTLVHPLPEDSLLAPDYRAAIDSLTRALAYGPLAEIYQERGEAYYHLKDYSRAFLDFRQALILDAQDVETASWYGNTLVLLAARARRSVQGSILDRAIEILAFASYLDPADSLANRNFQWARLTKAQCSRLVPPCR
jgi:tetratricopeptide (TPR) repeat protein